MKPIVLRRNAAIVSSLSPCRSRPPSCTLPAVGWSSPPSRFSSVDLPQPLGPMIATNSPLCTVISTPPSAVTVSRPTRYVRRRLVVCTTISGICHLLLHQVTGGFHELTIGDRDLPARTRGDHLVM